MHALSMVALLLASHAGLAAPAPIETQSPMGLLEKKT